MASATTSSAIADPIPIDTIESQDNVHSEGEDIFKCPLPYWSLCDKYLKKKELRKNEELVETITKVLGVPVDHRSFSMSKLVVMCSCMNVCIRILMRIHVLCLCTDT